MNYGSKVLIKPYNIEGVIIGKKSEISPEGLGNQNSYRILFSAHDELIPNYLEWYPKELLRLRFD